MGWERLRKLSRSFFIGDEAAVPDPDPSPIPLRPSAISSGLNRFGYPLSNMPGALEQPTVLHDLAGNHSVLILRVNGAQTMVAVRDDHLGIGRISYEEQRG